MKRKIYDKDLFDIPYSIGLILKFDCESLKVTFEEQWSYISHNGKKKVSKIIPTDVLDGLEDDVCYSCYFKTDSKKKYEYLLWVVEMESQKINKLEELLSKEKKENVKNVVDQPTKKTRRPRNTKRNDDDSASKSS